MTPSLEAWLNFSDAELRALLRQVDEAEALRDRVVANIDSVHLQVPVIEECMPCG